MNRYKVQATHIRSGHIELVKGENISMVERPVASFESVKAAQDFVENIIRNNGAALSLYHYDIVETIEKVIFSYEQVVIYGWKSK